MAPGLSRNDAASNPNGPITSPAQNNPDQDSKDHKDPRANLRPKQADTRHESAEPPWLVDEKEEWDTWGPMEKMKAKKPQKPPRRTQKSAYTEDGDPVTKESSQVEPKTHKEPSQGPKNPWVVPKNPVSRAEFVSLQEKEVEEPGATVIGARELPDFPWAKHAAPNASIKRLMAKINEEDTPKPEFNSPNLFESFSTEPLNALDLGQMSNVIYLQDQVALARGQFIAVSEQLKNCRETGEKEQGRREQAQWDRSRTRLKNARLESGLQFFFERSKTHVELAKTEKQARLSEGHNNREELKQQHKVVASIVKEREEIQQEWTNLRAFAAQIEKNAAKPVDACGNHVAQPSEATKKCVQLELPEANARVELQSSLRWAPLLKREEEAEERLNASDAKLFKKEHKRECDVRFSQGVEIGRKAGQEEGYYSGYNSGYVIAVSDTHKKSTNKLVAEARVKAKIEGIEETNDRWQTKQLPVYFESFKTLKEEGEAELTAKLRAEFNQKLQLQHQDDEKVFVSLGYHMATTHQIRRQIGLKFKGNELLHADRQAVRIGHMIANAVADGVPTNTWDHSPWRGALDESSEMWIYLPEGVDRSKTENTYYESLLSSYDDRMKERINELERQVAEKAAKAARVAAARTEEEQARKSKQETFGDDFFSEIENEYEHPDYEDSSDDKMGSLLHNRSHKEPILTEEQGDER